MRSRHIKLYYIWYCTLAYISLVAMFLTLQIPASPIIVSLTGIYLSLLFFFQKQRLEELRVFKELFTEFNSRYDRLNDKLVDIANGQLKDDEIKKTLDDYFNLCSEEYLFYTKGLIVGDYWSDSQKEQSYYGLTSSVIDRDAELGT